MNIRIFNHRCPNLLVSNVTQVDQEAENLTALILNDIINSTNYTSLEISTKYLDDRAQLHCDKWIEETATHMSLYSLAQQPSSRPPLSVPTTTPLTPSIIQRQIIQYKSFSGDVSGVIGEAIFSALLKKYFRLHDDDFAHFRADKYSGIYPDFGIFRVTAKLLSELNWDGNSSIGVVVPAEIKTATDPDSTIIRPRLRKAILQIQNFWTRINSQGASIICVAIRNQVRGSYDIAIAWVR